VREHEGRGGDQRAIEKYGAAVISEIVLDADRRDQERSSHHHVNAKRGYLPPAPLPRKPPLFILSEVFQLENVSKEHSPESSTAEVVRLLEVRRKVPPPTRLISTNAGRMSPHGVLVPSCLHVIFAEKSAI
jgi:hypothetical protein